MPTAFTREQQEDIREELFRAGIRLSKSEGMQGMTVSRLAASAGIAKGSFYHFFESKETFILALMAYAGEKLQQLFARHLRGRERMTTHEFIAFLRDYMNSEYDLLNGLTLEDMMWLKTHMSDTNLFETATLTDAMQSFLDCLSDVRDAVDVGTIVNLIKGMYMMRESKDTMIETSLDNSIEVMLKTLELYITGNCETKN
jgi:AcrR family transcriptional regulator